MDKTLLEIPAELKSAAPVLLEVLSLVQGQIQRGTTLGPVDIAGFQTLLTAKLASLQSSLEGLALASLDIDEERVWIDGVLHRRVLYCPTSFMGMAGSVSVLRGLFRPVGLRNAPTVDVVALRAGVVGKVWLPGTAREMAFLMQQNTSREAEAIGCRLHCLPYSHAAFETVAHAVGKAYTAQHQAVEEKLIQSFAVPKEARSVSVSLDRVCIPMEEPRSRSVGRPRKNAPKKPCVRVFRQGYCGTVTLHDDEGEAIHTIRYGTMPDGDPESLCEGMADDVVEMLAQRPDLKVVLVCDGAKEMWNLLDAEFTKPPFDTRGQLLTRLIDFWHTIEKLAAAANVMYSEGEAKVQLARWKLRLRNTSSACATILAELTASGKEDVQVADGHPVHDAITYLRNNGDRMDYAAARRAKLPIGSGNVEATGKSLFGLRMKRTGSRWKTWTGEHIVHLRALALSDRWDQAMTLAFPKPRIKVRKAA